MADRYRIERELGAGGMATVYLAEDLRHQRKVAVKVLRSDLAASLGPERFLREVTIAANLQHPHILPLYDSGQVDGTLYYVMPFVEGTSLRQKLLREGELPIADAVRILRDVADAIAYAHAHQVVHRDVKPENVMLSGRHALVTDFGVAKAVSEATGAQSLTTAGVALGTPTYMAPEQATADPHIDGRADIYAWGVIAYELLAGRPPFAGPTPQAVLAAHLTLAPEPVTTHRQSIPPLLASVVMKALEKKPADRWQTAQELVTRLEAVLTPSGGMPPADAAMLSSAAGHAARATGGRMPAWVLPAVLLLAGLAVGTYAGGRWLGRGASGAAGPVRFTIPVTAPQLDPAIGQLPLIAVAPDGRSIVYADGAGLQLRDLGSFTSRTLEGTAGAVAPAFSPDGQSLVFGQGGRIRKLQLAGGQVVDVATANFRLGASWAADGFIYFSAGLGDRGIWRVGSGGGAIEPVTQIADSAREQAHGWPQVLPGGQDLLYTVLGPSGGAEDSRIVVERIGSKSHHTVIEHSAFARYVPTGHLIYSDVNGALFAIRYDLKRQATEGPAVPALDQRVSTSVWGGRTAFDVSPGGTFLFIPETAFDNHVMVTMDRTGANVRTLGNPANLRAATVAPDGASIATTLRVPGHNDVWLYSPTGTAAERLTLDVAEDEMPVWSPDGRRIAYSSALAGEARRIMVVDVVDRKTPTVLRTWSRHVHPWSWSHDGKWLASYDYHPTNNEDIWAIGVGAGDSLAVATTAASELNPVFSPDGRWLAYQSSESGRYEIYVTPFPSLSARRQVSTGGGTFPRWDSRGTALYFLEGTRVMMLPVRLGAELNVLGSASVLFDTGRPAYEMDVFPGGNRFLALLPNPNRTYPALHVVTGWLETLR